MSVQRPVPSAATVPPLPQLEYRLLDNQVTRPFRTSGRSLRRPSHQHQHAYIPSPSDAPDTALTGTDYRQRLDLLGVDETEPPAPPPQSRSFPRGPLLLGGVQLRSRETVIAERKSDPRPVELFLATPEKNVELVDGRKQTPIPIISGEHAPISLRPDEIVGIDISSLLVLAHLFLLRETLSTFEHIVLPPDFESQLQEQRDRVSGAHSTLVEEIDEIISTVKTCIESGRASLPGRTVLTVNSQETGSHCKTEDKRVAWVSECDIVCIDDPEYNSCDALIDNVRRSVPVACTIDILRALRDLGTITKHDYWLARHKLRQGGFTVIMVEPDELHYWLNESLRGAESFAESSELRIIRHSTAHVAQHCESGTGVTTPLLLTATDVCSEAIRLLWIDETISIQQATLGSDWIWNHVSSLRYLGGSALDASSIRLAAEGSLAQLLVPQDQTRERHMGYVSWLVNSVLPVFQYANPSVIDRSLDLIVNSILGSAKHDDYYGHIFMKRLPTGLAKNLLRRHQALGVKWNFKIQRSIAFDLGPNVFMSYLIECARQALKRRDRVHFSDDQGRKGSVYLGDDIQSILVDWIDENGKQRSMHMPDLSLLSPSAEVRVHTARGIARYLGATSRGMHNLIDDLASRTATNEEVFDISNELVNGVKVVQERLHRKVMNNENIDIDDLVPHSIEYFERLIGPHVMELNPDGFIQDVVIPYRVKLLNLDLKSGLEIACIGFLSDTLAPGEWVKGFSNDDVWDALNGFDYTASPFVLLAALDIALYRQDDARYQGLALRAMNSLCYRSFGRSDSFDTYEAFRVVIELVENRINSFDSGVVKPGYWKRMAAWMQAALFVGYLTPYGAPDVIGSLREFAANNMTVAGQYAITAGALFEPLAFAARTTDDVLYVYLVERLLQLMRRHGSLGHEVPKPSDLDSDHPVLGSLDESARLGLPGPLDGHRVPTKCVPPELSDEWLVGTDAVGQDFPWQAFVTLSQTHELNATQLTTFQTAVRRLQTERSDMELSDLLRYADYSGIVAAASRDSRLADAVADLIARIAGVANEPSHVAQLTGYLLQAAGAHGGPKAWSEWLDKRLVQVAKQLPPPPSESSRVFVDLLDELAVVLPVDSWVQLRARAISASIATTAPQFRRDFIEGGWLGDALSSLDGIREESNHLGFDVPSDTAIQSARAFLDSLSQIVRQTPDVQPLQDGEIGIDFYNQTGRGGVLFVIEVDGSGACYTIANGVSQSFSRSSHKDLLDNEICEAVISSGVG